MTGIAKRSHMPKDINVLVVEEDLYSRDMMTMLLTRDWRTRVVAELPNYEMIGDFIAQPLQKLDVILIGLETPRENEWPFQVIEDTLTLPDPPVIVYAGTNVRWDVSRYLEQPTFGGYLLKSEIAYSIAAAVAYAHQGDCVITPGVCGLIRNQSLNKRVLIVDGSQKAADFSRRESEIIHLGILFNMSQRDMADELLIGTDWISETMSHVYEKLGLHELLNGQVSLRLYFDDELILSHFEKILARAKKSPTPGKLRKAPWMSTLAFHLLTVPEVRELL
jgi:DNA-binding NarL/FixJ family response regulator